MTDLSGNINNKKDINSRDSADIFFVAVVNACTLSSIREFND